MAKQSRKQQIVKQGNNQGHLVEEIFDDNLLPDAAEIEKLMELDPTIIDWLKKSAEKEQDFRHQAVNKKIDLVSKSDKGIRNISLLGLVFSFLIVLSGMAFSAFLLQLGYPVVGTLFAGATMVSIVALFMAKVSSKNK